MLCYSLPEEPDGCGQRILIWRKKMIKYHAELVEWTDKLSCGVKLIDDQHKGLVSLVNEMFNHINGNEVQ